MPAIENVLKSGRVLQGVQTKQVEEKIAKVFDLKHCVALNSGTDALSFSIAALGLKPKSRIAVPSMTFIASASAIVQNNCIPVFVDVNPTTMLMDQSKLINLINSNKVDAVIAVHLYGQMQPLRQIVNITKKKKIPVIEDAAQALGSKRNGNPPGQLSDITCLSFDPTKVIGAYGSGGAVMTNSLKFAEKVKLLRYHGNKGAESILTGYNSQIAELQAAIINIKLKFLKSWQERRNRIAEIYLNELNSQNNLSFFKILEGNIHNNHKFVILCDERNKLLSFLDKQGIGTKIHYAIPLHNHKQFRNYSQKNDFEKVEHLSKHIISLPIYPELKEIEIKKVINSIKIFYK